MLLYNTLQTSGSWRLACSSVTLDLKSQSQRQLFPPTETDTYSHLTVQSQWCQLSCIHRMCVKGLCVICTVAQGGAMEAQKLRTVCTYRILLTASV